MPAITVKRVSATLCVVDPSPAYADRGERVTWINETGAQIDIFFPTHQVVFANFPGKAAAHTLIDTGDAASADVRRPGAKAQNPNGKHHYAIYCEVTGSFAVGGSDPELDVQ